MKDKVHVRLRDISKTYGDKTCALKNINLDVMEGEVLVLLGPSGCGKSTLLRIIGGYTARVAVPFIFTIKRSLICPQKKEVAVSCFKATPYSQL